MDGHRCRENLNTSSDSWSESSCNKFTKKYYFQHWTETQSTQFKVRKKGQCRTPSFFKLTEILPRRRKCNSMNVAKSCTIMYWCTVQIRRYLPDILSNPALTWLSNRYTTRGVGVSGFSGGSPLPRPPNKYGGMPQVRVWSWIQKTCIRIRTRSTLTHVPAG